MIEFRVIFTRLLCLPMHEGGAEKVLIKKPWINKSLVLFNILSVCNLIFSFSGCSHAEAWNVITQGESLKFEIIGTIQISASMPYHSAKISWTPESTNFAVSLVNSDTFIYDFETQREVFRFSRKRGFPDHIFYLSNSEFLTGSSANMSKNAAGMAVYRFDANSEPVTFEQKAYLDFSPEYLSTARRDSIVAGVTGSLVEVWKAPNIILKDDLTLGRWSGRAISVDEDSKRIFVAGGRVDSDLLPSARIFEFDFDAKPTGQYFGLSLINISMMKLGHGRRLYVGASRRFFYANEADRAAKYLTVIDLKTRKVLDYTTKSTGSLIAMEFINFENKHFILCLGSDQSMRLFDPELHLSGEFKLPWDTLSLAIDKHGKKFVLVGKDHLKLGSISIRALSKN